MKINYFNYEKFDNKYLLTNDFGRFSFVSDNVFENLVSEKYENIDEDIVESLKSGYFIYDENDDVFIEKTINLYRENKNYLFRATSLHIFVLTNACNMGCVYCQAQDSDNITKGKMSVETAKKAVDIALQSPSKNLTFEFQGGEPLINFEIIRFIVEYAEQNIGEHEIEFTVVTNTLLLNDEIIAFLVQHNMTVSTSLDGDETLHNSNRPFGSKGSYAKVVSGIARLRDKGIPVGAIQTTTRDSLGRAKAIIDTYIGLGFGHIFIRPLTPLGYAKEHWDEIGYTPEEFIKFYSENLIDFLTLRHPTEKEIEDAVDFYNGLGV